MKTKNYSNLVIDETKIPKDIYFAQEKKATKDQEFNYDHFSKINGLHPFQEKVPGAYVSYNVRTKPGTGKVMFFNFELAKEIGLIAKDHPHEVSKELAKAIIDTFGLLIINEYDIIHKTPIDKKDIRPHKYMATRYLQLQHPNKKGKTSGDGRSLWNGFLRLKNTSWDFSSSGTGATCLSPATAIENRFFKTGDPYVSYGCGSADADDGISASIMSEIFHRSGIPTERTLAIIEYGKNSAINVRAGKNLIRPSHFFNHLKQGNWDRLKAITDYYIDRQIDNGIFPSHLSKHGSERYHHLLSFVCESFARAAARFEREYIFCWMGWDGDNILTDGGIIDYGSVRQFGLFHHKYRFDDVDRFSTNLVEQKREARYMVQTFAQLVDFLISNEKKNVKNFKNHPILHCFDQTFEDYRSEYLLRQMGFHEEEAKLLMRKQRTKVREFEKIFQFFERETTIRGPIKVSDGINRFAIFSMRNLLYALPTHYLQDFKPIESNDFLQIIKSKYASKRALKVTRSKDKKIKELQHLYMHLVSKLSEITQIPVQKVLIEMNTRSIVINRPDRITGDAILHLTDKMLEEKEKLNSKEYHHLFHQIIHHLVLRPEYQELLEKWQMKEGDISYIENAVKRKHLHTNTDCECKTGVQGKVARNKFHIKEQKILNKMTQIIQRLREGL